MVETLTPEEKKKFIRALEEDREFRYMLMGLLGYREVLDRIIKLEERFAKLEERLAKLEERFTELEERVIKLEERFARLEERFARLEERQIHLEKLVTTIAHRFGVITEVSFREAFENILSRYFGATASKWSVYDEEGIIFGYPTMIDVGLVIKDNVHILVEVKSRVDPEDVYKLYRVGMLYEKKTGIKPRLAIIAGFISDKAREASEKLGVELYGYLEE
ncbi:MAG: hypothetical protein B6U89_02205 [Desulfurococcales archaeon ex4484_58]|nr:MAG: hypothetical protein B6U89_02205 [Desulfurococcales archaeon ex4484_58]